MSLLKVLQPFVLVDFAWAHPLNGGAPFGPHLLIGDSCHIKCCPNTGVLLAPEILRLDLGFLVGWEIFAILESRGELLFHDAVVQLYLLALGLLASNMGAHLMVLGAQPLIWSPWAPSAGKRGGIPRGLLVQGKKVAAVGWVPISQLLLQQTL